MVVLLVLICLLKMRCILTELMFANQVAINQQINGVVKCSSRNAVLFILHPHIQSFNVEMSFVIVNFMKNGKSFGRFPMLVHFEISGKYLLDFVLNLD